MAFEFDVALDGTFTAGVGVVSPATVSPNQVDPVLGSMGVFAVPIRTWRPAPTPRTPLGPGGLDVRTVAGMVHTMPTPALLAGRPCIPKVFGQIEVSAEVLTGPGHFRGFPDPDPVWDGSIWTTPPPSAPAGAHFMRWSARHLPDPATFPGNFYFLGTPSAKDGTTGIVSGAQQWAASGGSDFDIPWNSAYPFKPRVQAHVHYAEDGFIHTVDRAVHITPHRVSHMWADFGTVLTPPFTVLIVAIITHFRSRDFRHSVFDAGYDRTPDLSDAQLDRIWRKGASTPIAVSEAEGYRNALQVGHSFIRCFNDQSPTTKIARVPWRHTFKPKMLAYTIDGSGSHFNSYDTRGDDARRVTMSNHGAQRLWLLGRRNGTISPDRAASMAVFEIRAWDKALTRDQLDDQFEQLRSTWQFDRYNTQIRNLMRAES